MDDTTQYQFNCPYCADEKGYVDGKFNCEVSLSLLKFHCWSCGHSGSLSRIIKRWGGKSNLKEYYDIVEQLKDNQLYEFADDVKVSEEAAHLQLPLSFKKISIRALTNKSLRAYLKKRCIDQWTINKFYIGFTEKEDNGFSYRIIIPSYDEYGHLNYFVGRDYLPENKKKNEAPLSSPFNGYQRPKYKNCDADKKQVVFQESLIDWDADITLVEGTLDCIYGPNTISMLGKALSKDSVLFEKLVNKAKARVILCLDNDTEIEESLKICRLLESTKLHGRVYFIRMNEYKDFGDAFEKDGIRGIVKCLRSAEKYDRDKDI